MRMKVIDTLAWILSVCANLLLVMVVMEFLKMDVAVSFTVVPTPTNHHAFHATSHVNHWVSHVADMRLDVMMISLNALIVLSAAAVLFNFA